MKKLQTKLSRKHIILQTNFIYFYFIEMENKRVRKLCDLLAQPIALEGVMTLWTSFGEHYSACSFSLTRAFPMGRK